MTWTTLDGYTVKNTTLKAVLVMKGTDEIWIPRSLIQDGEEVRKHDTDLVVRTWFCEKEGLDG